VTTSVEESRNKEVGMIEDQETENRLLIVLSDNTADDEVLNLRSRGKSETSWCPAQFGTESSTERFS
jgi:hypothetical protein